MRRLLLALSLGVGLGLAALQVPGAEPPDNAKIARLIQQLGSNNFDEREKASKELDAIGAPALEALRKAAKSDDAETKRRAEELAQKIEKRAETTRVLEPTRVKLSFKETPVKDAVAELAKQSHFTIVLTDPENKLVARKVTLDTGETTFWQALDALCEKAHVTEVSYEAMYQQPGGVQLRPLPPPVLPGVKPAPGTLPVLPPNTVPPKKFSDPPAGGDKREFFATQPPPPLQPPPVGTFPPDVRTLPIQREPGTLYLTDGEPKKLPTCYVGALRLRALKPGAVNLGPANPDEVVLPLEVAHEPRLVWQEYQGMRIDKATDDAGQTLNMAVEGADAPPAPPGAPPRRIHLPVSLRPFGAAGVYVVLPVHLKKGEKPSKVLEEIKGSITARIRSPQEQLITADDITKAAGKTFTGTKGGEIRVLESAREDNGELRLKVEVEYPTDLIPVANGNELSGQGGFRGPVDGLTVLDAKGKPLPLAITGQPLFRMEARGGVQRAWRTWTFTVKKAKDGGEPVRLVFTGTRTTTVGIPFRFKDVALQ